MDLRQLRQFLAAVEHRNLGRAAASLHITTPALSKSLANLETELGVRLVDRGPRGVTPTVFGASLARHAKTMAAEERHARADIARLQGAEQGRIAVGGTASAGGALLVRALAALSQARPGVRIDVVGGRHGALIESLRDGALDLVVTGFGTDAPDPNLKTHVLADDTYATVVRAAHPLARRRRIAPADVVAYPWVVASNIAEVIPGWASVFTDEGLDPPQPAIASDSYLFIKSVLGEGDFVAVLPRDIIGAADAGVLAVLKIQGVAWSRRVRAVTRARGTQPPAVDVLLETLSRLAA